MEIKKLKSLFRRLFNSNKAKAEISESEYYENLFVKNEKWNNPNPNEDETKRWNVIEGFISKYVDRKSEIQILDLGCGRGWLTNLLSKFGSVQGIEPVEPVVAYAKKLFPSIHFQAGYSTDLINQGLTNHFDLIVSSEVFEHVPDDQKSTFVSTIFELLKNGGHAIITTPRQEAQEEWLKYFAAGQPVEDWITEEKLLNIFSSNGFSKVELERVASKPKVNANEIDIYQVWIFKKGEK